MITEVTETIVPEVTSALTDLVRLLGEESANPVAYAHIVVNLLSAARILESVATVADLKALEGLKKSSCQN